MIFNEYWKEKSAKQRKSWAAKAKRYAVNHSQLEEIRKEVYLPLDFNPNFRLDDLKPVHFTNQNPLIRWDKAAFSFSEEDFRAALKAQEADLATFRMEVSRESIEGKAAPLPEDAYGLNEWEDYRYGKPNKVYDSDRIYFDWLLLMYRICTDMETVHLSYKQISMTIRRYSNAGRPFAYYELNPCEQLCHSAILFQETDFYTFDVSTLLMEMAAEWELRQEELNYYAKHLRLWSMDAALTDSVEFTPWDEKKVLKKTKEYIEKGYSLDKIVLQLRRPWKASIKKFFDAQTEMAIKENAGNLEGFNKSRSSSETFVENVFCPFIEKDGDDDVEIVIDNPYNVTIKVSDSQCRMTSSSDGIFLYPNANFTSCFWLSYKTPLKAISDYLKVMPDINHKTDEMLVKAIRFYDQFMKEDEHYRTVVETLDPFIAQYAGKPVGKLMKFIRLEAGRLLTNKLPLYSIKILNDRAFSYQEKDALTRATLTPNGLIPTFKDVIYEGWLDPECHIICKTDPLNTDVKEWEIANPHERWHWPVYAFIERFLPRDAGPVFTLFSADFIEQKL